MSVKLSGVPYIMPNRIETACYRYDRIPECVSHPNSKYRVFLPQSLTGFNAASITFSYKLSYTELKDKTEIGIKKYL
jgi:hypothetical protein